MPTDRIRGAHVVGFLLDEAQMCFETLVTDGVPPRKAYETANCILPEGADLRAIHEQPENR